MELHLIYLKSIYIFLYIAIHISAHFLLLLSFPPHLPLFHQSGIRKHPLKKFFIIIYNHFPICQQ